MYAKAVVAACGFALGAGQRIFFFGGRVQKNRKVFTDWQKPARGQLFRRAAYHHPVAVLHRQAKQSVAHRTTNHENFHGGSLAGAGRINLWAQPGDTALQNRESHFQQSLHPSTL